MRKLVVFSYIFVLFAATNVMAFSDIGTSRTSCSSARTEAEVIARTHCLSLDTKPKIRRTGKCKKKKYNGKTEYRVSVIYKCQIDTARFGYY